MGIWSKTKQFFKNLFSKRKATGTGSVAGITHFPTYSVVNNGIRCTVDLSPYDTRFKQAQAWLGNRVLSDTKPLMPIKSGAMQNMARVEDGGRKVVYSGPYTRFQYMGKVMVDPVTLSPWARAGVKKIVTDRPLHYASPSATSHWFEVAKQRYQDQWVAGVKKIVLGAR